MKSRSVLPTPGESIEPTESGRDLGKGVIASVLSRGLAAGLPLLMIPIALDYIGSDRYGLWMTVNAVLAMVAWLDLGIGNGLLTKLSEAASRRDGVQAGRLLGFAYTVLGVIALLALPALWLTKGVFPWREALGAGGQLEASFVTSVLLVCAALFLVNLPVSMVQRAQYAFGEVVQSQVWQASGSLLAIIGVVAAVNLDFGATAVIGVGSAGPLLGNAIATIVFYCQHGRDVRPAIGFAGSQDGLLALSGRFFILSVLTSLATNADPLIISHAGTYEDVTGYAVPFKIFAMAGLLITLINTPFWPAAARAISRGDYAWAGRVQQRMMAASVLSVATALIALTMISPKLVALLGAPQSNKTFVIAVGLSIWWVLVASMSPRFMVQNAGGVLTPQTVGWLLFLVLSVPAKWITATNVGYEWVPYAGAIVYLFTVVPGAFVGYSAVMGAGRKCRQKG